MPCTHEMTLYIADRQQNELMRHFDLRPDYKWYIKPIKVAFSTTTRLSKRYFLNLIEKSKEEKEKWIPAIEFGGTLYCDPSVKELSNGQQIMFVN
jgi:hypothetical protein